MSNLLFSLTSLGNSIKSGLLGAFGELWYLVLINFVGVVAILIKILETQNKRRGKIVFFATLNYVCWIIYFLLNGDFTSTLVSVISFIQLIVFSKRGKYQWASSYIWLVIFLSAQVVTAVFTYRSPLSLFAITGGMLSTIAYFVMNEKLYRYLFFFVCLLWIGNGIAFSYYIALIHDIFATTSIVIAIFRYNLKKEKNHTAEEKLSA